MSSGPNHQPTEQETRAANALSVYAKISDPMAAVAQLGEQFFKSQIMRVSTPGDGAVLALTCICEGITPLEFVRTYHIIEGRPAMRADAMAARFLAAGGLIEWHEIGEAGSRHLPHSRLAVRRSRWRFRSTMLAACWAKRRTEPTLSTSRTATGRKTPERCCGPAW